MSRFYVGQWVRVARATRPEWQGHEGRIEELFPAIRGTGWVVNCRLSGLPPFLGVHTDQLEPILDQHDPCEAEFKASLDEMLEREGIAA